MHEFEEKSKSKIDNKCNPNHIHGILTIPNELNSKFWDDEKGRLSKRIYRDILSLGGVANCLIERARDKEFDKWTTYCLKEKNLFH